MMKRIIIPGILFCLIVSCSALYADTACDESSIANAAGVEFLKAGDFEKAEECFRLAIRLNSSEKKYYNNIAVSFMRRKKYTDAQKYLSTALSMDEKYAKALGNMAITCFYLDSYMDAYRYYLRAEDSDKAYTAARFEKQKAITTIENLSRENPDNSEYRQMLEILNESTKEEKETARK